MTRDDMTTWLNFRRKQLPHRRAEL